MVSAHPLGPNTLSHGTDIFTLLTLLGPKVIFTDGQIAPNSVTQPSDFKFWTVFFLLLHDFEQKVLGYNT